MQQDWINALLGGVLIGLAVSLMLLWNGRATGISGIIYGLCSWTKGDIAWRIALLGGIICAGFLSQISRPDLFSSTFDSFSWKTVITGTLVGFGTVLGSGCTSGHGICGISRLSLRSIVATLTFMLGGVLSVLIGKTFGMLP